MVTFVLAVVVTAVVVGIPLLLYIGSPDRVLHGYDAGGKKSLARRLLRGLLRAVHGFAEVCE